MIMCFCASQLLERAIELATYSDLSLKAYPSIKRRLQRPTLEALGTLVSSPKNIMSLKAGVIDKFKGTTRISMEKEFGLRAKL